MNRPNACELVVYEQGRWWATPPDGTMPVETSVPAAATDAPAPAASDHDTGSGGDIVVRLGPVLLQREADDRFIAWDHRAGRPETLDADDLRLLDGPPEEPVASLRIRDHDVERRLERLAALELVRVERRAAPAPVAVPTAAGERIGSAPATAPTATRVAIEFLARARRRFDTTARRRMRSANPGSTSPSSRPRVAVPAAAPARPTDPEPARLGEPPAADRRTRVIAAWDVAEWGQPLALGGLLAYARVAEGGRLAERYRILPVHTFDDALEELRRDPSPALVLFSDYIWSAPGNHTTAREVKMASPGSVVLHGGPHVPSYPLDRERFFRDHPWVDVAAHGEGEITFVEMLAALDGRLDDLEPLTAVEGLSVRTTEGVRTTPDRERHPTLEDFPSPYLTGEFDHLDTDGWLWPSLETNRGCPYRCTFCDWGSATRSRIRYFPLERVMGELDWMAERRLPFWMINDANFGIHPRDVEITRRVVELRNEIGLPYALYMNYAKNTVKHLAEIVGMLTEAGITGEGALAIQTRDEQTLEAIERSNIRTDKYDELAREFRRCGLPLVTDLIIGLPGQRVSSFLADLQYCFDNDITPRFFVALNLPNAEMNNPEYRERFKIVLGDGDVVVATSTFTREERERMMRLRMAYRSLEHFAVLRHVFHYLQWDHGIPMSESLERIERRLREDGERFPLMRWLLAYLDIFLIPPFGWPAFYAEVEELVHEEFQLKDDGDLRSVLDAQVALMPFLGRSFPDTTVLDHDVVAWFSANSSITDDGERPRLADFGPGTLTVEGDPNGRCTTNILGRLVDERPHELITNAFWAALNWELDSPLQRLVQENAVSDAAKRRAAEAEAAAFDTDGTPGEPTVVQIGVTSGPTPD